MRRFGTTPFGLTPAYTIDAGSRILSTNDEDYYPKLNKSVCKNSINKVSKISGNGSSNINGWMILSGVLFAVLSLTDSIMSIYLLLQNTPEIPVGTIVLYSGNLSSLSSAKHRWLLCNGSEISRTDYKDLFQVIGTVYGAGNGFDTFNLPDFRARFPLGSNQTDTKQFTTGGHSSHVITVAEMPAHAHDTGTLQILANGTHTHGVTDPGHDHGGNTDFTVAGNSYYNVYPYASGYFVPQYGYHQHSIPTGFTGITIQSSGSHTHGLQGITGFNGSNEAIDMMPPYQTIHYIIRA